MSIEALIYTPNDINKKLIHYNKHAKSGINNILMFLFTKRITTDNLKYLNSKPFNIFLYNYLNILVLIY